MSEAPEPTQAASPWRDLLQRSMAQIAAGRTVPLLPVLDRLRASAERLEAEMNLPDDGRPNPPR